jgi:hypothetical protein
MTKYHQSFPILWKIHPNSVFFNENAMEIKDESNDSESSETERSDNDQATEVNSVKDEKRSLFVAAGIDETTIRGIFRRKEKAKKDSIADQKTSEGKEDFTFPIDGAVLDSRLLYPLVWCHQEVGMIEFLVSDRILLPNSIRWSVRYVSKITHHPLPLSTSFPTLHVQPLQHPPVMSQLEAHGMPQAPCISKSPSRTHDCCPGQQ